MYTHNYYKNISSPHNYKKFFSSKYKNGKSRAKFIIK